jgi:kynurenine formamidase
MTDFTPYDELPVIRDGLRVGWFENGPDDQAGRFALQTPERIKAALELVREGRMFSLNADIDLIDPPLFGRMASQRVVSDYGALVRDDYLDHFNPQAASQWDALGHVAFASNTFYGGRSRAEIDAGADGIQHLARRGVAGRAVLVDVEPAIDDPFSAQPISVADVRECLDSADLVLGAGDVLIVNTGYLRRYTQLNPAQKIEFARQPVVCAGLERSEDMLRFLWDSGVSAVASDNPALEVWPGSTDPAADRWQYLHRSLLGLLGLHIGEFWWLADLVDACRVDGRFEVFLTSAPLNITGGASSTANALAFK